MWRHDGSDDDDDELSPPKRRALLACLLACLSRLVKAVCHNMIVARTHGLGDVGVSKLPDGELLRHKPLRIPI